MSDYRKEQEEYTLSIGDRLNYTYLLSKQILTLIEIQAREDLNEDLLKIPIKASVAMVPDRLRDEEFENAIKEAMKPEMVDVRPRFAGKPLDESVCKELGFPIKEEREKMDTYATLHALFNLWQKRKMLTRINWLELVTGERFDSDDPGFKET